VIPKLRFFARSVRPRDLVLFQCRGVASQERVEVGQQEASGFPGPGHVALVEGFHHFGNAAAEDGERVTLDQYTGKSAAGQAHHSVVPTVRKQLSLDSLHMAIQPDITV
jgi:hypothetical protein